MPATILQFERLSRYREIIHFISTRQLGSMTIRQNQNKLAERISIQPDNFVLSYQAHGSNVIAVQSAKQVVGRADAMITDRAELCLTVLVADCVPVMLYDPVEKVIGVVHAGWRGTARGIGEKTIRKMENLYGTKTENVIAGIGPSIGPCCYEVGREVAALFDDVFISKSSGKRHLNLWQANYYQLIGSGVNRENIEISSACTKCRKDRFYSYRGDGKLEGEFAAGLMISGDGGE